MRRYIPETLSEASAAEIEEWLETNRPYLRCDGRRFTVDRLAEAWKIPNHRKEFLERAIEELKKGRDADVALRALERYTAQNLGSSPEAWETWYEENEDYLFFSDSQGFVFLIDQEAKEKGIPFEKLRGWSSEKIDYHTETKK